MDQNNGLEAKISKGETRILLTIDLGKHLLRPTRIYLQDQTLHMGITIRTMEDRMINAEISRSTKTIEIDLETDHSTTRMGTGETMETFLVLRRLKEETSHETTSIANQELTNRRPDNRITSSFIPYEQKFPQNNNQTASNVVRFTTTDDSINEISDLCPLNN